MDGGVCSTRLVELPLSEEPPLVGSFCPFLTERDACPYLLCLSSHTCCRVSPSSPLVSPSKSPFPPGTCPPTALGIALTRSRVDDCRLPSRRDILPPSLCHRIKASPSAISCAAVSFSIPSPCQGINDCSGPSVGSISDRQLSVDCVVPLLSCVFFSGLTRSVEKRTPPVVSWTELVRIDVNYCKCTDYSLSCMFCQ